MKKIIVVEDDPAIRDAVPFIFDESEYQVTVMPDGNNLLLGTYEIPDLFLIDRQLPGVDGLSLCRHLKESPSSAHVPVIIMSASPHIQQLALDAGASDFISKPFSLKAMREKVDACCE